MVHLDAADFFAAVWPAVSRCAGSQRFQIAVTTAATNAVNLVDIGTDADTDGFVDGITAATNSTGFKGFFPCNGVLGMSGGATTASTATADEVEVVLSGDPGATGATIVMKFIGVSSTADAS